MSSIIDIVTMRLSDVMSLLQYTDDYETMNRVLRQTYGDLHQYISCCEAFGSGISKYQLEMIKDTSIYVACAMLKAKNHDRDGLIWCLQNISHC